MSSTLAQRLTLIQMQNQWASQINPVLANPLVNGQLLTNQVLKAGTTAINHGLGRKLQGWFLVGINGAATIYDNQANNQMPQLTLSLISNVAVTASIWVF